MTHTLMQTFPFVYVMRHDDNWDSDDRYTFRGRGVAEAAERRGRDHVESARRPERDHAVHAGDECLRSGWTATRLR